MAWEFEVTDEKAYIPMQMHVDELILDALTDGGKTASELMMLLFENHVGNAKSEGRIDLAYSSTGAIFRAAVASLRRRRLIYDSTQLKDEGRYQPPFRYFRRNSEIQ